jgi:hypothetical protein
MEDTVHHICNMIGVNSLSRRKMVECGMSTIDALFDINEDTNEDRFGTIRSDVVNNLRIAVRWLRENAYKDQTDQFTEEVFNELVFQDDFIKKYRGTDRYTSCEN